MARALLSAQAMALKAPRIFAAALSMVGNSFVDPIWACSFDGLLTGSTLSGNHRCNAAVSWVQARRT